MFQFIKNDPYYYPLYEQYGEGYVLDNGYFEDGEVTEKDLDESLKMLCTPLVSKSEYDGDKVAVILMTGGFNPVHDYHLQSVLDAREYLEGKGYKVPQCFIAPDSDRYTNSKKYKGFPIHERIKFINDAIKSNPKLDGLYVEPWGGLLSGKNLNFTFVYLRLVKYLKKHIGKSIDIFFVVGGDNARFSHVFKDKTIVVQRGNVYPEDIHPDAVFIENKRNNLSSTEFRKAGVTHAQKKDLFLRVDSPCDVCIFDKYFNKVFLNNQINVQLSSNYISLDVRTRADHNLEISRHYLNFGMNFIGHDNRPGSKSIEDQLKDIPKDKSYILFDDDTFTGGTMRFAKEKLADHNIVKTETLCNGLNKTDQIEILDAKDFILQTDLIDETSNNGLAIRTTEGFQLRVPYILPFVDPFTRCSVVAPVEFSIDIWKFNLDYFSENSPNSAAGHSSLFRYMGFDRETLITEICKYYIKALENARNS